MEHRPGSRVHTDRSGDLPMDQQSTKSCARCHVAPRHNPSYCIECLRLFRQEALTRHRQQPSDRPCASCHVAPRNSPRPSYCMDCYRAKQAIADAKHRDKRKPREACARCGKPMTGSHHTYCLACCRLQRTEWLDRNRETADPCARCHEAPRLAHMSYCRPCHRALAVESRERVGGKRPQDTCSKCGGKRDGAHRSYCSACWTEKVQNKYSQPCIRCGAAKDESDRVSADYCYLCWHDRTLQRQYGITRQQYEDMLAAQNNRCAICKTEANGRAWHVDHCHETGKVRGVLCDNCNRGLGHFKDSHAAILRAVEYLKASR